MLCNLFSEESCHIFLFSVSVVLMLYMELSQVCKETVTVIKDTCITYSANTLLGRETEREQEREREREGERARDKERGKG